MTFQEYASRWLERQTKYAPSTLGFYRRSLERVYPYIGSIKLSRLRLIALKNLLMELHKRTFRGKLLQEATVQKYLPVVSTVLSDAKRNEIIQKNPARMIDLPDIVSKIQAIPTDKEAEEFLNIIADIDDLYKSFYALTIYTGYCRGELCALKWSDFIVGGYEGILMISRSRTIYMSEDMMNLVRSYCYDKGQEALDGGFPFSDYLFTNENGELIHPDTFTKYLRRLYDKNGFPRKYHLHTLRHYFVSTMLHNGVDKQTVAKLAGHGDTGFLERTCCHPQMQRRFDCCFCRICLPLKESSSFLKSVRVCCACQNKPQQD